MSICLYEKVLVKHRTSFYKNYNDFTPVIPVCDEDTNPFSGLVQVEGKNKFTFIKSSDTEKDFLENYGNLFSHVEMRRVTIKVEKNDHKTVIKVFDYFRYRRVGSKFFKKTTHVKYLGFNEKDGSVYNGFISNYHKKRKFSKKMTKNCFWGSPCSTIKHYIRSCVSNFYYPEPKVLSGNPFSNEPTEIYKISEDTINSFLNSLNLKQTTIDGYTDDDYLYKLYLDSNKVKYPNNWKVFRQLYPSVTKKTLKKFDNKYIDSFMSLVGLNGDKVKRVLHIVNNVDINTLKYSFGIFGKNYILSQDDDIIKKIIESGIYNYSDARNSDFFKNTKEKGNAFEIFKLCVNGEVAPSTFADHIIFYNRLKVLENVKWKSNDYNSFLEEHYNWTEKLDYYNRGNFTRIYPNNFTEEVERPIVSKEGLVYPKLLKDSKEYNFESFTQSNCVKTYLKREGSVIISLRRGDVDSKDRATIEYKIIHDGTKVTSLRRIQSLGRFNNRLDETWNNVLYVLDDRVSSLVDNGIFKLPEAVLEVGTKKIKTKLVVDTSATNIYIDFNTGDKITQLKWDDEVLINSGKLSDLNLLPELGF